jgi:hypothetical protein
MKLGGLAALIGGVVWYSTISYVLPLHITFAVGAVLVVVIADFHAFLWVLGRLSVLAESRMRVLHDLVYAALAGLLTSGVLMFWPLSEYLLTESAFIVKMLFVLALVINSVLISRHMHLAFVRPFASLSYAERIPLFVSAIVSTTSWVGALVAAQFLGV